MKVPLIDVPPGAPHPFEPAAARHFVRRTGNNAFSRLFETDAPLKKLEFLDQHFPMGYTNLWILERALLRVDGTTHRYELAPLPRRHAWEKEPRFFLLGDDGSKLDYHHDRTGAWVVGYATLEEAEGALDDPTLAGASAVVIARRNDDIGWH